MIALVLAAFAQASVAPPCLLDGDRVTGEFRRVESRHPNGSPLRHGFVVLTEPICVGSALDGPHASIKGRWIDIFGELDDSSVQPGDGVTVELSDCIESMTAWHLGEINCVHARLISREPM